MAEERDVGSVGYRWIYTTPFSGQELRIIEEWKTITCTFDERCIS